MNYAIEILEAERKMLENILSDWEFAHYPDARKQRDRKLKDLEKAIEILENYQDDEIHRSKG